MSTLQAELRRIRKHLEATRKKLPSSPEMPEDLADKPCPKDDEITKWNFKTIEKYKLKHEQFRSEQQAKSWDEHKESK